MLNLNLIRKNRLVRTFYIQERLDMWLKLFFLNVKEKLFETIVPSFIEGWINYEAADQNCTRTDEVKFGTEKLIKHIICGKKIECDLIVGQLGVTEDGSSEGRWKQQRNEFLKNTRAVPIVQQRWMVVMSFSIRIGQLRSRV